MAVTQPSPVVATPAAPPDQAVAHFTHLLSLETDCWDVSVSLPVGDFVLLDVRGPAAFAAGHIAGAVHLPHSDIDEEALSVFPDDTLFVVYCAGPHCNGADRAARTIAGLGRPVKKMIGGATGWLDEGFDLTPEPGEAPEDLG